MKVVPLWLALLVIGAGLVVVSVKWGAPAVDTMQAIGLYLVGVGAGLKVGEDEANNETH